MIDAPRDIGSLTARDRAMTEVRTERFRVLPPVSIATLTGTGVPPRIDLAHFVSDYRRLGNLPLSVLHRTQNGENEYTVVGPRVGYQDLLALLDFVSPDKMFAANASEIIEHWDDMRRDTRLREGHSSHIPGWKDFEPSGTKAINYLRDQKEHYPHNDPDDLLTPVFRWKVDANGNRTIILTPLTPEEKTDLTHALPDKSIRVSQLNEAVGLVYLAAYSPLITTNWLSLTPYHPKHQSIRSITAQGLDFIQALALPHRMIAARQEDTQFVPDNQDLHNSSLFSDFESYAESGIIPVYDPLQAIRRHALDFFAGYKLTRQDVINLSTTGSAQIFICAEGDPKRHIAKAANHLTVVLSRGIESDTRRIFRRYELVGEKEESDIILQLTDYRRGNTSEVTLTLFNHSTQQNESVDLHSPRGKRIIQDTFDITFP